MNISKEDYLKLLQQIADEQYETEDEAVPIPEEAWIWADPPAKEKMKRVAFSGAVNAMNMKKAEIRISIARKQHIQVGAFLLRITDYYGKDPLEQGTLSFDVYERRTKTPTGHPCNMDYPADITADNRFTGRPWLHYFSGNSAKDVPLDTIADIVKWMQAIKKLSAFL